MRVFDLTTKKTGAQRSFRGWKGLLVDAGYSHPSSNFHTHMISMENLGSILKQHDITKEKLELFSVDIDGIDFHIIRLKKI